MTSQPSCHCKKIQYAFIAGIEASPSHGCVNAVLHKYTRLFFSYGSSQDFINHFFTDFRDIL